MGELPEGTPTADRTDYPQLARAAQACGIEIENWDLWGKLHRSSPGAQMAILASLGVDAGTQLSVERALEEREWSKWQRPLPPTLVEHSLLLPPDIVGGRKAER